MAVDQILSIGSLIGLREERELQPEQMSFWSSIHPMQWSYDVNKANLWLHEHRLSLQSLFKLTTQPRITYKKACIASFYEIFVY